ncbi:Slam-dependent surface lipoprotein [Actinobacillus equuli]|uniref:Transferrin-binding protein n=1 Tax=Actinobacillus equuli TaxID=718 RepID=A0AAX3FLM7_ACTEU|nr:Slam-dependent surface lipoprotein [Actinobacillus equuli]AIZ78336.1 hypothetical protein ACEE_00760 [Actinobacillus equuli subsp. equuli]WGE44607.1 transferrin-binding protein-like solute binding protein [Actinobacillus equuli subsp. equuli]VEE92121.1 transferrin-binding protein [Actinobacillus equuli]
MKKMTKLALTLLAGVVISACSSGGSGSSAKPQNEKPKAEQPKAEKPKAEPKAEKPKAEPKAEKPKTEPKAEQPKAEMPLKLDTKESGGVFIVDGASRRVPVLTKVKLEEPNLTSIKVDDIEIKFSEATTTQGNWKVKDDELVVCCEKYSDVRFGVYDGRVNKSYEFYNGNVSANIPASGKFKYEGDAYLLAAITDEKTAFGSSKFEADFAAKTLTGTLTFDKLEHKNIKVDSQILGNSFTGTATFDKYKETKAVVEGKFYGENAKELAGVFESSPETRDNKVNSSSWGGAFGAVKQ